MKTPCPVLLLLLLSLSRLAADPLVPHARQMAKAGDMAAAATLLGDWLQLNPGASGSAAVFSQYMDAEQDFPQLLRVADLFVRVDRSVPGAAKQLERIARLYDLSGRVEQARDAYTAAHEAGGSDANLVSAFLLSLLMNDMDAMSASLGRLSADSERARTLLTALRDIRAGDTPAARTALYAVAEQTGSPDLALRALWVLYQVARDTGDPAGQASAKAGLMKRFSSSPEAAIASAQTPASKDLAGAHPFVVQSPEPPARQDDTTPPSEVEPAVVASPVASPSPPSASAPPAAVASSPASAAGSLPGAASAKVTYSVQAGSFQMKENADDLVSELGKLGLSAVVIHESSQGKERFRVLAAAGVDREAARSVVAKLATAGLSGFVVQDK